MLSGSSGTSQESGGTCPPMSIWLADQRSVLGQNQISSTTGCVYLASQIGLLVNCEKLLLTSFQMTKFIGATHRWHEPTHWMTDSNASCHILYLRMKSSDYCLLMLSPPVTHVNVYLCEISCQTSLTDIANNGWGWCISLDKQSSCSTSPDPTATPLMDDPFNMQKGVSIPSASQMVVTNTQRTSWDTHSPSQMLVMDTSGTSWCTHLDHL